MGFINFPLINTEKFANFTQVIGGWRRLAPQILVELLAVDFKAPADVGHGFVVTAKEFQVRFQMLGRHGSPQVEMANRRDLMRAHWDHRRGSHLTQGDAN